MIKFSYFSVYTIEGHDWGQKQTSQLNGSASYWIVDETLKALK